MAEIDDDAMLDAKAAEHCAHKRRRATYSDSVAVYDGRRYLGIILPHGNDAFRAIDFEDRVVGDFASQREAAAAITRGVR